MSRQNEAHGDEDQRRELTERELELALEEIIETILDHGGYPAQGRRQFDLYEWLIEERDSSYAWEMYVASMSCNDTALANRRDRERKSVEAMLTKHLQDSHWVTDLAAEYAEEDAE